MAINIIYFSGFLIFSFLVYLIIMSVIRGINAKKRNKK